MENEAIRLVSRNLDCFAALAGDTDINIIRRMENEAIRLVSRYLDCFAALAMTMKATPSTLPVVCTRNLFIYMELQDENQSNMIAK